MIRAGQLRHEVTLQQPDAADTYGQPGATWSDVATFRASIESLSGAEGFAEQFQSRVTHRVVIRFRDGVQPKMRLKFTPPATGAARIFEIVAVTDKLQRRRELEVLCFEVV